MKHLVVATILAMFMSIPVHAESPQITAQSAVLIDQESGQVLYSKNPHEKRAIASTTKILTGLIAIENSNLQDIVTVTPKAASIGESTIHLEPLEKLTLHDLLYGALLKSGNDACVAIAEHVSGQEETFVELMNKKAVLLGAKNSSFKNTNGLPNEEHYSTAYDMALIASYAIKNPYFSKIVSTKNTIIQNDDESQKERFLKNTNKLLWQYPWTDGVKTGTTNKAGKCLIGSATKNGRTLVFVILHSEDREGDGRKLFEYGFNDFITTSLLKKGQVFGQIQVINGNDTNIPIKVQEDLTITIPKNERKELERKLHLTYKASAPISKDQPVGQYSVFLGPNKVKTINLIAGCNSTVKPRYQQILENLKDFL